MKANSAISEMIRITEINTFYLRQGIIFLNVQSDIGENYDLTFDSYEFLQFFSKETMIDIKNDLQTKIINL